MFLQPWTHTHAYMCTREHAHTHACRHHVQRWDFWLRKIEKAWRGGGWWRLLVRSRGNASGQGFRGGRGLGPPPEAERMSSFYAKEIYPISCHFGDSKNGLEKKSTNTHIYIYIYIYSYTHKKILNRFRQILRMTPAAAESRNSGKNLQESHVCMHHTHRHTPHTHTHREEWRRGDGEAQGWKRREGTGRVWIHVTKTGRLTWWASRSTIMARATPSTRSKRKRKESVMSA